MTEFLFLGGIPFVTLCSCTALECHWRVLFPCYVSPWTLYVLLCSAEFHYWLL